MANSKTSPKATVKKTPVKKTVSARKIETPKKEVKVEKATFYESTPKRSMQIKRSHIITAAVIFVVLAFLYLTRSWFVAATVNGQPISRLSVIHELEKSGGANALNTLVTKAIIGQEAAKKKIAISDTEVNDEIKKIEKRLSTQGQKLTDALSSASMTMTDLKDQIKYQKILEKLVGDVTVTDKEISDYIEKNKESLPKEMKEEDLKAQVKESLRQQKLNDKIQPFIQSLQSKARVSKWVSY